MSSFFMRSRREFVTCSIPVFAAVLDKNDDAQKAAWREAKYTIASPNNKEEVDFRIARAADNTGAYAAGEHYPINTTQLVVSTRSENPALAEFRIKSLDWENYTRPASVEIIYEEKENVDLNITVSIGKLCTRLSCAEQEKAVNPNSTIIFSPRVKKEIDEKRAASDVKTRFDGYKRYSAVVSIPHTERTLINACTSGSLPGSESGVESAKTTYNVDTDAFTANVYIEQVSNAQYAVAVGQHVGFLTFRFDTEFSGNLGPANTVILGSKLGDIFGRADNPYLYVPAHTANYNSAEMGGNTLLVKSQCKAVRKDGKERLIESMVKVPLSDGMYACVPRPCKHMSPDSEVMREVFAREWKRRNDPKAKQYEKIVGKMREHEESIARIRNEMSVVQADEKKLLGAEAERREEKLVRQKQKLARLMETNLQQYIDTTAVTGREIASSPYAVGVCPASAGLYTGDAFAIIKSIHDGKTVQGMPTDEGKMIGFGPTGDEISVNIRCASSEMSTRGVAVGLNSEKGEVSPVNWASAATAIILPAAFKENTPSTACVGKSLTTELLKNTDYYTGAGSYIDYGEAEVEVTYDYVNNAKTSVRATRFMPLANMANPYFSATETNGGRSASLTCVGGILENCFAAKQDTEHAPEKRRKEGREEGEKKASLVEAYRSLKACREEPANAEAKYCSVYLPENLATQANRTEVTKLSPLAEAVEYVANRSFIPESKWTIGQSNPQSVRGLILSAASFTGRALLGVVVHIKDTNGDWVSVGEPGEVIPLDGDIGGGLTPSNLISEAWATGHSTLFVSPVPVYDKSFGRRCVRLSPIGDSLTEQTCYVTAIALSPDDRVVTKVGGVEEERYGGILFLMNTYFTNTPFFSVSLPKQLPDESGNLVDVNEGDKLFTYHCVHCSVDFTGDSEITNGWSVGATVLGEIPAGFPNGVSERLEYPEPLVVLEAVNELFTNYNGGQ